jgi:hypothetical protein
MSSIGLCNVLIGFLVVGITNLTPITIVPIIVSAACAIADGLSYYAYYADYPITQTAVAAVFADFFWLVSKTPLYCVCYAHPNPTRSKKLASPSTAMKS